MGTNFWNHNVTAASNTTIGGIGATGANTVSNFDNITRDIAAQLRRFANDQGGTCTVGGTADIITLTTSQTITAYVDGLTLAFVCGGDNTVTGVTANIDTLGAKTIKKSLDGVETALAVGDMQSGGLYGLRYRSAWASAAGAFQLIDLNHASLFANLVEDTTPQLGGALDTNSKPVYWSKGADIASATALTLGTDGNSFDVTGTTTITSINTWAVGGLVVLHFDGALTLTHHSTDLILPGAVDITTAAGDIGVFYEYAAGDWRCVNYQTATAATSSGGPVSMQVFTTSGTWTRPSGITKVKMTVVGGGGGSGDGGNGSGSGGVAVKILDVSAISSSTITVGSGGSGNSGTGNNGGNSSWADGTNTITGGGGVAGDGGSPPSGGTASGGDWNFSGFSAFLGTGQGASTPLGFGEGGAKGASSNGENGKGYGSGGGGALTAADNGGDGADGIVIVEEY